MLRINKKKICDDISICKNIFSMARGLMFRSKYSVKNRAWIFIFKKERKISITMMFVFFPIDIIFIDKNMKIVEIKKSLKPFQNYFPKKDAMIAIELEEGTIIKNNISTGQIVKFDKY
ncbi:MAG: DUF192 domain-containing protein [Candidatus Woesearchaeota archaeon]